jgi:hypothetical protein
MSQDWRDGLADEIRALDAERYTGTERSIESSTRVAQLARVLEGFQLRNLPRSHCAAIRDQSTNVDGSKKAPR